MKKFKWAIPSDANPVFWLRCALIVVAVYAFVRAIRYGIDGEMLPDAVKVVTTYVPVWGWGIAWAVAGFAALACVPKAWPIGSLGTIALCFGFAVGYTVSWLTSDHLPIGSAARGDYVGASNYWTVALLLICGYFGFTRALKKPPPPTETP